VLFAVPAFIASRNPDPPLSILEIVAATAWVFAFAGETTADRQRLRFAAKAEPGATACRGGLWRWLPHAHAMFETATWSVLAMFRRRQSDPRPRLAWVMLGREWWHSNHGRRNRSS
jgi:steroid 5-alpha reductase family enzyme